MDLIEIVAHAAELNPLAACGLLFLASFLENILPPLPGDMVTVFGGYLAGSGDVPLLLVFAAVTGGSWVGFLALFALGRALGHSRIHAAMGGLFPHHGLERAEEWFRRWGYSLVLANRFLAGTRSVISLFAGIAELDVRRIALFSLISAAAWNALLIAGGMAIGENHERLADWLVTYNWAVLTALAVCGGAWLLWMWLRRRVAPHR